jgi:hypothetical protein
MRTKDMSISECLYGSTPGIYLDLGAHLIDLLPAPLAGHGAGRGFRALVGVCQKVPGSFRGQPGARDGLLRDRAACSREGSVIDDVTEEGGRYNI